MGGVLKLTKDVLMRKKKTDCSAVDRKVADQTNQVANAGIEKNPHLLQGSRHKNLVSVKSHMHVHTEGSVNVCFRSF